MPQPHWVFLPFRKRGTYSLYPPQKAREGTMSKEAVAYVLWEPGDGHRACVT